MDHARYLDAWFDAIVPARPVTLVVHDWGSALGFDWARRHPERVRGVVYMEALVRPVTWEEWPEPARKIFQAMRSPGGEEMVLQKNVFVERILPASVLRGLTEAEMAVYRRPFLEPGESRRPTLTWPRQIPIDGEPADVVAIVDAYAQWLAAAAVCRSSSSTPIRASSSPGRSASSAGAGRTSRRSRCGAATSSRRIRRTRSARRSPRSWGGCRRLRGQARNSRRTFRNSSRRSWCSQWPARSKPMTLALRNGSRRPSSAGLPDQLSLP